MTQLNQITQQNASSSEELAATAEEMSSQAEQLQEAMSFFTVELSGHDGAHKVPAHRAPLPGNRFAPAPQRPSHPVAAHHPARVPAEAEFTRF
jgi:methyl-accepting chemotaxis protein